MSNLGNREIFAKNLEYYMILNNKTRNEIASDLDIPYTTLTSWLKGQFYPRIDKIEQLANYFEIQKSDLVEDKKNQVSNKKRIDLSDLSDEEFKYIQEQIEYIRWKKKN